MKYLITISLYVLAIIALLFIFGCSSAPIVTKFDGKWEFCENEKGETRACLQEKDVKKLREILIRCKSQCGVK